MNENNNNNKNENYFNDKIKEEKENAINNINNKYNELKELINNKNDINELDKQLKLNEYNKKINYKFIKDPQNLKYKCDITNSNIQVGYSEILEIFISYKDNKEYIISPNINYNNLDIFTLLCVQQSSNKAPAINSKEFFGFFCINNWCHFWQSKNL